MTNCGIIELTILDDIYVLVLITLVKLAGKPCITGSCEGRDDAYLKVHGEIAPTLPQFLRRVHFTLIEVNFINTREITA